MINLKTKEKWRNIDEYMGHYAVSSLGNIKSMKRKHPILLKQFKNPKGYLVVKLYIDGISRSMSVHRLVMRTFEGNSELEVNHINGDTTDNRLVNLEYVSLRENMNHRFTKINNQKRYGISFQKSAGKYSAQLHTKRKKKHLGLFNNEDDAYDAFYSAYLNYHGVAPWSKN